MQRVIEPFNPRGRLRGARTAAMGAKRPRESTCAGNEMRVARVRRLLTAVPADSVNNAS